jgi:tRNA U34 2-thiouridine synthase MnmA/TrmU
MDSMTAISRKVRALGLCSGGLDSILAALVLRQQGIEVAWISFETPFFPATKARAAARMTGIPLSVVNITAVYLPMLRNPACGYGKHMNPCMDCHALMFRLAGERLAAEGYDFLFSGEVLGQRPMSQTRTALRYVEKHSGYQGLILRPLSARKLPETLPELDGRVDRSRLLDLAGRSRKPQIELARALGVCEYPAPAGGCLLTDKGYAKRLRDLFDHTPEPTAAQLELLKHGRHFRLAGGVKVIVGRTHADNLEILKHRDALTDITLKVQSYPGPVSLVPGQAGPTVIHQAAAICAGYSRAPRGQEVVVLVSGAGARGVLRVIPLAPAEAHADLL